MNKTVLKTAIILVLFSLAGFTDIETAKADVNMSGQCVQSTIGASVNTTPRDICLGAGYYDCISASGTYTFYSDNTCATFLSSASPAACGNVSSPSAVSNSRRVTNLICRDTRQWGELPAIPNVPQDFNQTILNLTNWILGFVTMIAVLALIWGGVNYLTSAGNEDQAKTGKKIIQYAIIGLVIAGLAYALVVVIVGTIL